MTDRKSGDNFSYKSSAAAVVSGVHVAARLALGEMMVNRQQSLFLHLQ
jgi:hypothetical protein